MEPLRILFFAIASFIGIDDYHIVSQKVNIAFNPLEKTIYISQEDLFSIMASPDDSIAVVNELYSILNYNMNVRHSDSSCLTIENIALNISGNRMNATIKCSYSDPQELACAGINVDTSGPGYFYMVNIPEWHVQTSDAELKENYWVWPMDKSINMVIRPFEYIPEALIIHKKSLLPYYKKLLKE